MYGHTHARRLVELTRRHQQIVDDASADGRITTVERERITDSAGDVLTLAALIDSGDRLGQAARRARDRRYFDALVLEYEAWLARMPEQAA